MALKDFDLFTKMLADLPPEAIIKTLDLECKMLQSDLEFHHSTVTDDAFSIMCFRQFVRLAKQGAMMRCIRPLPPRHVEFYQAIVTQLVQSDELPPAATEQFGFTFPSA